METPRIPALKPQAESEAFSLLDVRIQRFLWQQGWNALRDIQELAIPQIIQHRQDVIIAAATASGKTEAAMLPALTQVLASDKPGLILYVSPLKALINDQFSRLLQLCETLDVNVWPWHGDISQSIKSKFLKTRTGVLLITPEALEGLLCNKGSNVAGFFQHLSWAVVDELHAFMGGERGKQLQSILHRIERSLGHTVPRIGLSATLGDMRLAAAYLRPGRGADVHLIESRADGGELKILLKGFEEPALRADNYELPVIQEIPSEPESLEGEAPLEPIEEVHGDDDLDELEGGEYVPEPVSPGLIAKHLFKVMRGSNNLIFPNSRREVERYTHLLTKMCKEAQVPNEFWPHHGNLSREIRAETEAALKQTEAPASAVCTSTLELGIDIGSCKSIAQIGPPPAVSSLRQRLGRSGRREGEAAILRAYSTEDAPDSGSPSLDKALKLDTIKIIAMISLLLEGWFEPPIAQGEHFSTLIQQILSFIAQQGGASAAQVYSLLCAPGAPFQNVTSTDFLALLKHLGAKELIMQDSSGELLHGRIGEKLVNHYSFLAAFAADEEFRLVCKGKTLGTMPVSQMLREGQRLMFAGKTWLVQAIDDRQKTISVIRTPRGTLPTFASAPGRMHTRVHARMRQILEDERTPAYLDATAKQFLRDAREAYRELDLANQILTLQGADMVLLTWLGDSANEALACMLRVHGLNAVPAGPGIEIYRTAANPIVILDALKAIAREDVPPLQDLLKDAANLVREKWDWALPESLLRKAYASLYLNIDEAVMWAQAQVKTGTPHTSKRSGP